MWRATGHAAGATRFALKVQLARVSPRTYRYPSPTSSPTLHHHLQHHQHCIAFRILPVTPNHHTTSLTMTQVNYRLIDVDALDPENAFPAELLTPQFDLVAIGDIQALATQCRQLLQRGNQEAALRSALENVPYGGDDQGKVEPPPIHCLMVIDTSHHRNSTSQPSSRSSPP